MLPKYRECVFLVVSIESALSTTSLVSAVVPCSGASVSTSWLPKFDSSSVHVCVGLPDQR